MILAAFLWPLIGIAALIDDWKRLGLGFSHSDYVYIIVCGSVMGPFAIALNVWNRRGAG